MVANRYMFLLGIGFLISSLHIEAAQNGQNQEPAQADIGIVQAVAEIVLHDPQGIEEPVQLVLAPAELVAQPQVQAVEHLALEVQPNDAPQAGTILAFMQEHPVVVLQEVLEPLLLQQDVQQQAQQNDPQQQPPQNDQVHDHQQNPAH